MSPRNTSAVARAFAAAVLLMCGLAASAMAQTAAPTPSPQSETRDAKPSPDEADLSITARVTAREVLFRKVPNPSVEFTGKPERNTLWESERENLPEQVQPGVTYRNVGITLRIVSVFADIDRIVAEALGEIPASNDPAPSPSAPEQTPPQNAPPPANVSTVRVTPQTQASPADTPSQTSRRGARRNRGTGRGTP